MTLDPVHFSNLKHFALSPAHYIASLTADFDSPAMRLGRLTHTLLLGGPPFEVWEGERRGDNWKRFKAIHAGKEIVSAEEYRKGLAMERAVRACPDAMRLLEGRHEEALLWEFLARSCSSRVDVIGTGFITDLKTTKCSHPARFVRDAMWMGYHAQIAFYQGAAEFHGYRVPKGAIVAVENQAPWTVTCFELTERALEAGRKLCRVWFEQLLQCEASGEWPGYVQTVQPFDVPEDIELNFDEEIAA